MSSSSSRSGSTSSSSKTVYAPNWAQMAREITGGHDELGGARSMDPVGSGKTHETHLARLRSLLQSALGQRIATKAMRDALPFVCGKGTGEGGGLPPTPQLRLSSIIDGRHGPFKYEEAGESTNDEATIVRELLLEHLFHGDTKAALTVLYDHLSGLMEQPRVCTIVTYAYHCARSKMQLKEFHRRARLLAIETKIFADTDTVPHHEYLEVLMRKIEVYNEANTPQLTPPECRAMIYQDLTDKAANAGASDHESIKDLQRIVHQQEYKVENQLIRLCANSHRIQYGAVRVTRGGYLHSSVPSATFDPQGRPVTSKIMFGRQRSSRPVRANGGSLGNGLGHPDQVPLHLRVPESDAHGGRAQAGNALAEFSRPGGANGEYKCTPATCEQSSPCKICKRYTINQVNIATTNSIGRRIGAEQCCQCEWITVLKCGYLQHTEDMGFWEQDEFERVHPALKAAYSHREYMGKGWPHQQDEKNFQNYMNVIDDVHMSQDPTNYCFEAVVDNVMHVFFTVSGEKDDFDFANEICPACGECHENREEAMSLFCIYKIDDNNLFAQEGITDETMRVWDGVTAAERETHLLHRRGDARQLDDSDPPQMVGMGPSNTRDRIFWNATYLTETSYRRGGVNSNTLCWHNLMRIEQERSMVVEKPSQESLAIVRRLEATSRRATADTMFTEDSEDEHTNEELKIWLWLGNLRGDHIRTLNSIIAESGIADADPEEFYKGVTDELLCKVHTTLSRDLEQAMFRSAKTKNSSAKDKVFSKKLSVNEVYSNQTSNGNPLSEHNQLIQGQRKFSLTHKPVRFKCFHDTRCDGQHYRDQGERCEFLEPENDELNDLEGKKRRRPGPGGERYFFAKICAICHAFGITTKSGYTPRHFAEKCPLRVANGGELQDDKLVEKVNNWKNSIGDEFPNGDGPKFFESALYGVEKSAKKKDRQKHTDNGCREYAKSGKCKFGDKCKYEHVDKNDAKSANNTGVKKQKRSKAETKLEKDMRKAFDGAESVSEEMMKDFHHRLSQKFSAKSPGNGKRKTIANNTDIPKGDDDDSDGESKSNETGLKKVSKTKQREAKRRANKKGRDGVKDTKTPADTDALVADLAERSRNYDKLLAQQQAADKATALAQQMQREVQAERNLSSANADSTSVGRHVSRVSFAGSG